MSICNEPTGGHIYLYNGPTVNMVQSSYDIVLRLSDFPEEMLFSEIKEYVHELDEQCGNRKKTQPLSRMRPGHWMYSNRG